MDGILKALRKKHPELDELPIISASTPDFRGALQDGYVAAVNSIANWVPAGGDTIADQVAVLVSSAFTPGDVQEIKDIVTAFGLRPILIPDLSGSLDGHLDPDAGLTTNGGTTLEELKLLGRSVYTLAVGYSMESAANILEERFGIPYEVFDSLTGLAAVDEFIQALSDISGQDVPDRYRHQRCQLQDAMLDTHFFFGRKKVALALEPDLLYSISWWLYAMGATVHTAVTTTKSKVLKHLPIEKVTIGDLEDFENLAQDADLLVTNSHGAKLSKRMQIPLYRLGFPVFDRLGNGQRCIVGYRGTTQFLFEVGNILLETEEAEAHAEAHAKTQAPVFTLDAAAVHAPVPAQAETPAQAEAPVQAPVFTL